MAAKTPEIVMPPPTAAPPESGAWQELESVMDELAEAARTGVTPDHFYSQLVSRSVQSLAALGGAAWLRGSDGVIRSVAHVRWPGPEITSHADARRQYEARLARRALDGNSVVTDSEVVESPLAGGDGAVQLLVGTVPVLGLKEGVEAEKNVLAESDAAHRPALAVVEIAARAGASPAVYQGQLRFLAAVCEIAAEYHAFGQLRQLRDFERYHRQLFDLSRRVHQVTGLRRTAYELANEGVRVIGCDRLSVATARGKRCRLMATSGVKQLNRRAGAVRQLERLAGVALRFNEPIYYAGDTSDCLPQVAELLEQYTDQSHARQLAIVPVALPPDDDETGPPKSRRSRREDRPVAVLIAEQFDAQSGALIRERVAEVARVSATAVVQATRWDRLPLRPLLELVGRVRDLLLPRNLIKAVTAIVLVAAAVSALVFTPADFTVEAPGTLEPSVRRHVFASRNGLVDEVLVRHGDSVNENEELIRLRDSELDLRWKRISGELETTSEQLDAVRATKTGRAAGDVTALESYRLSAEERQLEQELDNLRRQLELLDDERQSLVIRSPLAGRVITWDVERLLAARPVDRGQVLLSVADLTDRWQLELDVPDDRIGYVLAARDAADEELPVEFRLSSNERERFDGQIEQVAGLAEIDSADGPAESPTIRVTVSFDKQPLLAVTGGQLRPGMTARARIHCGQRPLGYVWLHDIWDAAVRWFTF